MNVTILFGDREKKSSVDQIAQRAREAVDLVLARIREKHGSMATSGPIAIGWVVSSSTVTWERWLCAP